MQHFFKTTALLILLTLNLQSLVRAQSEWLWGKRGNNNGGSNDRVTDMATDPNGNVYLLTPLTLQGDIHGQSVTSHGGGDFVLTSFSCDGALRWNKVIGTTGGDAPGIVRTDSLGGVYVLARFHGNNTNINFGTDTVIPAGLKTMALFKYDTSGSFKWLRMPQPDTVTANNATPSYGSNMDVDGSGNIFILSVLYPGNFGGSGYIVSTGGNHILKYNRDGTCTGGHPLNVTSEMYPPAPGGGLSIYFANNSKMRRDHARDRYYFVGALSSGEPLNRIRFGTTDIAQWSAYIACYDGSGSLLWVKQSVSPVGGAYVYEPPVIDPQGNVYIAGSIFPGGNWDGHAFVNTLGPQQMPFVIKKDLNGDNVWVKSAGTTGSTGGTGIGYTNNKVLLHGYYPLTLDWDNGFVVSSPHNTGVSQYLVQFDAQSGTVLRLDSLKSSLGGLAYTSDGQLITDSRGNAFMSASFNASVSVAGTNLGASSQYDWMLAKFGTDNCNCTMPAAAFTSTNSSGTTVNFTYTGTTPYTGISWDFGNGSAPATTANPSHTYAANGSYTVCVTVTNDCGSHTFCNQVQAGGTGIENIPGLAGVKIYPNPAAHSITIEQAMPGTTMELYGTTGQHLSTKNINNPREQIDIHNLPQGIYLIRLTTRDGQQATTRFIKQ